jgi:pimeloyl-ACP methyl ester carboxylesterase
MAASLVGLGHPVVTVDLRGHGRSDRPAEGYDIQTVADDLQMLIAALGLDRPVAVGQSWGANVVVELGHRHPHCVCGVVAIDGGVIELAETWQRFEECWQALAPPTLEGTPLVSIERWMREAHPDWPESGIAGSLANFEVRPDGTVRPWLDRELHRTVLHGLWRHRPSELWPTMAVPTLFVMAATGREADGWEAGKRRGIHRALTTLGRRGRARWFEPADHDVHAQHPAEVAGLIHGAIVEGFLR